MSKARLKVLAGRAPGSESLLLEAGLGSHQQLQPLQAHAVQWSGDIDVDDVAK